MLVLSFNMCYIVCWGVHAKIVIVLHGSRDSEYVDSVRHFAERVGVLYAFVSLSRPSVNEAEGDVYIPLFIGYGKDYERAVSITGFETPPVLRWPRIKDFLISLGPGLYVFHGDPDPRFLEDTNRLGLRDIAFLKIKPTLRDYMSSRCPGKVIPVVLTHGVIYREILRTVNELCPGTEVVRPLFELETFISYFREKMSWLVRNTRPVR
ncbi:hypothetical protein Vsou_10400 [Vulcanisaeta souniana JCM 11219]|uniref:Sirohydrochlorin cobaltochelatase n=2 Tax=Vulcanisaeta souniana TaxID=164452 RepID=A0A830E6Y4_9CREN|nr:hypothetical protein Vsou_10400 [Vulcanisaeta souniana JCM 11219]GGI69121.1 hypothetical protein GCM10007112_02640 [Vulcanisaeta souniana JCM 11219]